MTRQTLLTRALGTARAFFRNTRIDVRIIDNPFSVSGKPLLKEKRYFVADTGNIFQKSYGLATSKDMKKHPYVEIPRKEIQLPEGFARTLKKILESEENNNTYAQS